MAAITRLPRRFSKLGVSLRLLAVLAVAATCVLAGNLLFNAVLEELALRYERQLPELPDDEARRVLKRAPALGESGIGVLVSGMGDSRAEVSERAADLLRMQLYEWTSKPTPQSGRQIERLAKELAARLDSLGGDSRMRAARLARTVLEASPADDSQTSLETLMFCEQIIRATLPATEASEATASRDTEPTRAGR